MGKGSRIGGLVEGREEILLLEFLGFDLPHIYKNQSFSRLLPVLIELYLVFCSNRSFFNDINVTMSLVISHKAFFSYLI